MHCLGFIQYNWINDEETPIIICDQYKCYLILVIFKSKIDSTFCYWFMRYIIQMWRELFSCWKQIIFVKGGWRLIDKGDGIKNFACWFSAAPHET